MLDEKNITSCDLIKRKPKQSKTPILFIQKPHWIMPHGIILVIYEDVILPLKTMSCSSHRNSDINMYTIQVYLWFLYVIHFYQLHVKANYHKSTSLANHVLFYYYFHLSVQLGCMPLQRGGDKNLTINKTQCH